MKEVKFSADLVPVAFPAAKPVGSQQAVPAAGELRPAQPEGRAAGGGDHARHHRAVPRPAGDARYTLKDAAGKVVAGRLPLKLDGEPHKVDDEGARGGDLLLRVQRLRRRLADRRSRPGRPAVCCRTRGRVYLHLGQMQEMFFYVPKGTRALQYFWSGGPHKVLGPDRKVVAEVTASDEVVTVPVPAGRTGRCGVFRRAATATCGSSTRRTCSPRRRPRCCCLARLCCRSASVPACTWKRTSGDACAYGLKGIAMVRRFAVALLISLAMAGSGSGQPRWSFTAWWRTGRTMPMRSI